MPSKTTNQRPLIINEKINKRDLIWLWMYINKFYPEHKVGPHNSPATITNIQNSTRQITDAEIEQQMQASMLMPAYYSWVKNDVAQIQWLTETLIAATGAPESIINSMWCDRDYVIGLFDLLGVLPAARTDARMINNYIKNSIEEKKKTVLRLQKDWELLSQPKKALEWFDEKSEPIRLKAALQTFKKQFPHFSSMFLEFNTFEELIDIFERNQIHTSDRLIFLSSAKRKYSQLKSREKNKGKKKQCNVELSLTAINRLKTLATKYEISNAAVLEILLKKESERGIYIPEQIKQIYDEH